MHCGGYASQFGICRGIADIIDTTVLERIFRACLVVCRGAERKDK